MKYLLVLLLAVIVISLFSGLYFMYRGKSQHLARALTARIALSLIVFAIVIAGLFLGWFPRQ